MTEPVRIDKWLWAVRIFKTRSLAAEACMKGHVLVQDMPVKPSHHVKTGEKIKVRKPPIYRSFVVLELINNRVGAKDVEKYMTDITPPEELELLKMKNDMQWNSRDRGTGRPTKKERRDLEEFFDI
jgi:ribosome-associated heat shock protein Hsp15